MPHTTRQNYKSKLLQRDDSLVKSSLGQSELNDKLYNILEKEERDKRLLHRLIAELADLSVEVIRTMDKTAECGALKFMKCEELNDDKLKMCDVFTVLNRTYDVLLTAEERITELSEVVQDATGAANALSARTLQMLDKTRLADELQHELYNIGKAPTDEEVAEFERAEREGAIYVRSFSERSLQTHNPINIESLDEETSDEEDEPVEKKLPASNKSGKRSALTKRK